MIYVDNKEFNFSNLVKSYNLNSLQCKGNIIQGMQKIKTIMNEMIGNFTLYKVQFPNTIRLDDFIKEEKKSIYDFKKNVDQDKIFRIKQMRKENDDHPCDPRLSAWNTS